MDKREYDEMKKLVAQYPELPMHVTEWDYLLSELRRIKAQNPHFSPELLSERIPMGKD